MGRIAARRFVMLLCLLSFVPACASATETSFPGALSTEPDGLVGVDVERETLTIDLRPLAERAPARVSATYKLENHGEPRRIDLAFAGTSLDAFRVQLDGESVATHRVAADPHAELPPEPRIPSIVGGTSTYHADVPSEYPTVALDLPKGEHELRVEYEGRAALDLRCRPTVCWRFAHVLAPARTWASFGGLDATILVPPGWAVLVDPTFVREGDALHASFTEVPADAIGLDVRASVGAWHRAVTVGAWSLFAIAMIGGAWACLRAGRWCGTRRSVPRALAALVAVLTWALAILCLGLATVGWPRALVPESQAPIENIGDLWALLVAFAACPIGMVLALVGAYRAGRRPTRRPA